jgi:hypothetical protein
LVRQGGLFAQLAEGGKFTPDAQADDADESTESAGTF